MYTVKQLMESPIEVDYHSSYFMFVPSAQLQKHSVGRNVGKEHALMS